MLASILARTKEVHTYYVVNPRPSRITNPLQGCKFFDPPLDEGFPDVSSV